uniref:Uncharacterized protein n=1 Tax=Paramormyrops kingsleyae TaxID=1676925 RepID=A0A3B3R6A3_9TELE
MVSECWAAVEDCIWAVPDLGNSTWGGTRFWQGGTEGANLHGFRPSINGMLGPGVCVSQSFQKAQTYPKNLPFYEQKAVLKLRIRAGKVKKINWQGHPLQKTWHDHGYDTAWVPYNREIQHQYLQ